jgi:hypothetical protein
MQGRGVMWRISAIYLKLWYGQYSLARSFWGFLVFGTFAAVVAAMLAGIPFILIDARPAAGFVFQLVFWGYLITAAVGVWRSANALIGIRGGRRELSG